MRIRSSKQTKLVRLAIVGTGSMANAHAEKFSAMRGVKLVSACDLDQVRVDAFAKKHRIPATFTDLKRLLAECECDAVSIITPDSTHASLSIQALKAGKHVLCEKPLALTYLDARKMTAAARKAGTVHMVNLSYRNWPALYGVAEKIQRGELGEIRHVEASYLQSWLPSKVWGDWRTSPTWLWRLSTKHGSRGVLGDVGVHIVDFATFPAGPIRSVFCKLKTFEKTPGNAIGEYVLDANDSAVMTVEFANGALGTIHATRWAGGHANRLHLKISGTKGSVDIDSERSTDHFKLSVGPELDAAKWIEVKAKPVPSIYERFIKAIREGTRGDPDFERGAAVQKVLDACLVSNAKNRPVTI